MLVPAVEAIDPAAVRPWEAFSFAFNNDYYRFSLFLMLSAAY